MRELVYRAIRRSGERPDSGRAAMLGLAEDDAGDRVRRHGRMARRCAGRGRSRPRLRLTFRRGSSANCRRTSRRDEWPALLDRAPLDLRVNVARTVA